MPVTFKGVGSGVEVLTGPERAAHEESRRRIVAPHSRHAASAGSDTLWMYSFRREHGGVRRHSSARYS
jgi:hypothetical protein